MYRAVELIENDKDLHRFVWGRDPDEPLQDYRMTRESHIQGICFLIRC